MITIINDNDYQSHNLSQGECSLTKLEIYKITNIKLFLEVTPSKYNKRKAFKKYFLFNRQIAF